jgi:Tol biopolymer transport system component
MKPAKLVLFTGLLCAALSAGYLANQAKDNKAEVALQAAIKTETVDGNLKAAIEQYKKIAAQPGASRAVVATALLRMGQCYEKLGDAEARKAYERLVRDFADQAEIVAQARMRLAALGGPGGAGGLVTRRVLTDASGVRGVLTADGKYISHIDGDTGDMIQFEVASGQTSRITNKGGTAAKETPYEYQAFSRDGKQIAYDSYTKDWVPQLRIRNLDGSGLHTLYSEKGYDVRPLDWSPDAGFILASRELDNSPKGGIELTLISTADGSVRVLRSITSDWVSATFSPDGRSVAFSFVGEGSLLHGDVFLMTVDGRNEVVVAGHPADDKLLGWTPDGTSLVFLSDRSGTWDIWTVHITGGKQQGEPELLKKDFEDSEVLGFAPNGSLYYKTATSFGHLYNGAVDLETGKVLVPPAPVTTRYTSPTNFLTWSPDGRNLAYLSHPGRIGPGNNILTIRSVATGEERFLSPRLRGVNQISWAPDGRSVIALGFTATGTGAFRIDTETSEITKLADEGVFAHLCPDGKTLVHWGAEGIIKRNLDTGEESEVVKTGAPFYDLSPDGREVVFQVDGAVKTVSLNGGEPRELFRGLAQRYGLRWTRDGRYIIAQASGTASSEIWRVPAQGGTPLKLDLSVPELIFFALHPDNRRFAFSVNEESKSELWVLENFLPPLKVAK